MRVWHPIFLLSLSAFLHGKTLSKDARVTKVTAYDFSDFNGHKWLFDNGKGEWLVPLNLEEFSKELSNGKSMVLTYELVASSETRSDSSQLIRILGLG